MNTQEQRKLSESLLAACKAAGIEKPDYVMQRSSGIVYHMRVNPDIDSPFPWTPLCHPPYVTDWQDSLLEFKEYALIRKCNKCQSVTAIDLIGNDENEKELQCEGETVFRVSKEEAHGAVIKLCKCACGVENFNITKSAAMAKWRESFEFTETEKQQIEDYAVAENEPLSDVLARHPEHIADASKMIDPYKVQVGGVTLDPYMIASIYGINDPIIFQMLKKLLRFGRKHKDEAQDVIDTITSAIRWLEINAPESAKALIKAMAEKGGEKL